MHTLCIVACDARGCNTCFVFAAKDCQVFKIECQYMRNPNLQCTVDIDIKCPTAICLYALKCASAVSIWL